MTCDVEQQGTRFTCSPETGVGGGAHRFVCGKHIAENGDWFAASKVSKEKSGQNSVVSRTERVTHMNSSHQSFSQLGRSKARWRRTFWKKNRIMQAGQYKKLMSFECSSHLQLSRHFRLLEFASRGGEGLKRREVGGEEGEGG